MMTAWGSATRCGTAHRPAREQMFGNTAQFAELTSPSEGIPKNAVSLLRSCESLWMGAETVDSGETPLKPVPDVLRCRIAATDVKTRQLRSIGPSVRLLALSRSTKCRGRRQDGRKLIDFNFCLRRFDLL